MQLRDKLCLARLNFFSKRIEHEDAHDTDNVTFDAERSATAQLEDKLTELNTKFDNLQNSLASIESAVNELKDMLQGGDGIIQAVPHFKPANNLQELDELIQQSNVSTVHQYIFVLSVSIVGVFI